MEPTRIGRMLSFLGELASLECRSGNCPRPSECNCLSCSLKIQLGSDFFDVLRGATSDMSALINKSYDFPDVCDGCAIGIGLRFPVDVSCRFESPVRPELSAVERCDLCGKFQDDFDAAMSISCDIYARRCVAGHVHVFVSNDTTFEWNGRHFSCYDSPQKAVVEQS